MATGFCDVVYAVDENFGLESVKYSGVNDGAFSGLASVSFLKNGSIIATEAIAVGVNIYTTFLGSMFSAGDTFAVRLTGDVAIDQALQPLEGNLVPEPGALALAGLGLLSVGYFGRRRRAGC